MRGQNKHPAHTRQIEPANMYSDIGCVLAIGSGKGGVGKSLVASLLAVALNEKGYKVGLLDADITGPSQARSFGITKAARGSDLGLEPAETTSGIRIISIDMLQEDPHAAVIWRGPILAKLIKQFWTDVIWGEIDILLVDLPPGTGDIPMTVLGTLPVDGVFIVTSPQAIVTMIVEKSIMMAQKMDVPIIGLIENMTHAVCPSCGKENEIFGPSYAKKAAAQHKLEVLARLMVDERMAKACDKGLIGHLHVQGLDLVVRRAGEIIRRKKI